jgi:hypothetical protein
MQSTRPLSEIVPLIKQPTDGKLQQSLSVAIAVADIRSDLVDKIYALHPDLKAEFRGALPKIRPLVLTLFGVTPGPGVARHTLRYG